MKLNSKYFNDYDFRSEKQIKRFLNWKEKNKRNSEILHVLKLVKKGKLTLKKIRFENAFRHASWKQKKHIIENLI